MERLFLKKENKVQRSKKGEGGQRASWVRGPMMRLGASPSCRSVPDGDLPTAVRRKPEGEPHSPSEGARHRLPDSPRAGGDLDIRVFRAHTQS